MQGRDHGVDSIYLGSMQSPRQFWVYFITNKGRTVLYVGRTNNLQRRLFEHRTGRSKNAFTWEYQCWTLVYFETFPTLKLAIAREKQFKNWKREWKDVLVEKENPKWSDLSIGWDYNGWFDPKDPPQGFYTQNRVEQWGGPEGQR
jgi:putative endonuclease